MADHLFHRPGLAAQLSETILSKAVMSSARSGLFLAAPRRTGKSTFLREDLVPVLARNGAAVLYVDLWADRSLDPGDAIVSTVRAALGKDDSVLLKAFRKAGLDKVAVGGLSFDVNKIGLGTGVTISMALAALSARMEAPIVLIIDEAQHAATTAKGSDALFALKAARDELNSSSLHGLRVVATGSSRPKLAMLRASKDQAFYLAPLKEFPPLGRDYVSWFVENAGLPFRLDVDRTAALFEGAGSLPELMVEALSDMLDLGEAPTAETIDTRFEAALKRAVLASNKDLLRRVAALTPLQDAVLRVLAVQADDYAPYAAPTLAAYQAELQRRAPQTHVTVDTPNVQSALQALQTKSLIWRSAHGEYALEESRLADLLNGKDLAAAAQLDGDASGSDEQPTSGGDSSPRP